MKQTKILIQLPVTLKGRLTPYGSRALRFLATFVHWWNRT